MIAKTIRSAILGAVSAWVMLGGLIPCLAQEEAPAAFKPDAAMERSAVPDLYKWDLASLFESDERWEQAIAAVEAGREKLRAFEGQLSNPPALYECLTTYFELHVLANRITLYANLKHTENLVDPAAQTRLDRGLQVMDGLMSTARFIRGELMKLDEAEFAAALEAVPALIIFKPYIEGFRRRQALLLSEEGERILALAGDNLFAEIDLNEIPAAPEKAFQGLMSDISFPEVDAGEAGKVRLSLSNYGRLRGSENRAVRRAAVEAFFATLKQYRHALAAALSGQVAFNSFLARSRGYDRALDAYLGKDNVDTAVYDNLVAAINANLGPLHRYMAMRKKIMGVDELRLFDLYVPMVPGVEREVGFDEARAMILDALQPLGGEYAQVLAHALDPASGWLDLYPCRHKESGAFSASTYGCHPFVKMNYFNSVDDAFTLAHEYGHALHSYFSMASQPPATFRYVSFIAEVASTFNETLLSRHLIDCAATPAEKLHLLNLRAESIRTTIYRQALFAEFEKRLHDLHESGATLTAELISSTYRDLTARYYGSAYTIGPDDDIEWAYIPHFYWKFYVYTYATGLSAGIALAQGVADGGEPARDRYVGLLKGGCSLPPIELLKRAGVDLTTPAAVEAAAGLLDRTLDEMESLL